MISLPDFAETPCGLFLEGRNDAWVIRELLAKHDVSLPQEGIRGEKTETPFWKIADGVDTQLEKELSVFIKTSLESYAKFGVLIDADEDATKQWAIVHNAFKSCECQLPENNTNNGIVFDCNGDWKTKRVGVWLMPDNASTGKLESFLLRLIPETDPVLVHAAKVATEAKALGAPYRKIDFDKAHVHTWLAWQEKPGMPLSAGIHNHYFKYENPLAKDFVEWFKRLFLEE
jgi:hypothetical protein